MPVSDIDPLPELETHFTEMGHFPKAQLFMQCDAGGVGKRNSADHEMKTSIL